MVSLWGGEIGIQSCSKQHTECRYYYWFFCCGNNKRYIPQSTTFKPEKTTVEVPYNIRTEKETIPLAKCEYHNVVKIGTCYWGWWLCLFTTLLIIPMRNKSILFLFTCNKSNSFSSSHGVPTITDLYCVEKDLKRFCVLLEQYHWLFVQIVVPI